MNGARKRKWWLEWPDPGPHPPRPPGECPGSRRDNPAPHCLHRVSVLSDNHPLGELRVDCCQCSWQSMRGL